MPDDPKRAALLRAARYILAEVRRKAPTDKSSRSFFLESSGNDVTITSHDTGTVATERGWRHPLFGNRENWYGPSGHQRGRRYFVEKAADRALDQAADQFLDEYLRVFTRSSAIWEEAD